MSHTILQGLSVFGAVCILFPFAAIQFGWLERSSLLYNLSNLAGAVSLLVVAIADNRLGFILLEIIWGLVSIWGLVQVVIRKRKAGEEKIEDRR